MAWEAVDPIYGLCAKRGRPCGLTVPGGRQAQGGDACRDQAGGQHLLHGCSCLPDSLSTGFSAAGSSQAWPHAIPGRPPWAVKVWFLAMC